MAIAALLCPSGTALGRTVRDEAARTVRVPEWSERIVSLAPSITEILFALGAGGRVVGVTRFSDYPPEAGRLPKVGSYVELSIEKILVLKPDLVIATKDGNPKAVVDRLAELGVPAYVIDPRTLEGVLASIRDIGRLIGAEEAASRVTRQMAARIRRVERRVSGRPRPRVFFQIGTEPIVSAGRDTFTDILIRTAGGLNVTGEMTSYPQLSLERVLEARPEIIFISPMAGPSGTFTRLQHFWQQWPGLPAVKNGRIYLVNADICDRPSPRIVGALEQLARMIHPEAFQ
jgi:iron complex transport system substrate-binding protein